MRPAIGLLRDPAEHDPLDRQFGQVPSLPAVAGGRSPRLAWWRGASPGGRAVLVLLPLGMALGPLGLGLLPTALLDALDPVVAVIIGVLGVLVGLGGGPGVELRRARERRLALGAAVEAAGTAAVVGAVLFAVMRVTGEGSGVSSPALWIALAALAAAAHALPVELGFGQPIVAGLRASGNLLLIPALALLMAWAREGTVGGALAVTAQAGLVSVLIACAAWLLTGQTTSDAEQRVFAAGALLLVAGAADYLSLSALFAGIVTGATWQVLDGPAREHLSRDTRYAQHPMVAVLLLVAGARVGFTLGVAILVAAYVVSRAFGAWTAGWLVRRTLVPGATSRSSLPPASPAVVAIALALDASGGAMAGAAAVLLPVVVFGMLASELLSALVPSTASDAGSGR